MPITYPPPPGIVVPLDLGVRNFDLNQKYPSPDSGPGLVTRTFRLDSPPQQVGNIIFCTYVEEYR